MNSLVLGALGGALATAAMLVLWTQFQPAPVAPGPANTVAPAVQTPSPTQEPEAAKLPPEPEIQPAEVPAEQAAAASADPPPIPGPPPLSALARTESAALRELGTLWGQELADGDPCTLAQRQGLQCYRTSRMTLHGMRQLDRPGVLALRLPGQGTGWAVLTHITSEAATLKVGERLWLMPLTGLADIWRGDYTALWRTPPGQRGRLDVGNTGPAAAWLVAQLDAMQSRGELPSEAKTWQDQVKAFQKSRGADPDGVPGPMTFMLLNRASGVDEPHLTQAAP